LGDRLRAWLPVALWAGIITLFSSHWFSGEHTSSVLLPILSALFPGIHPSELARLHAAIRKGAHVTEYLILGLLTVRALRIERTPLTRASVVAVVLGALFAASDEIHQSFVPTRTAAVGDVLIDTVGVVIGVAGWFLLRESSPTKRVQIS
jgi:VanZ family protein